jgi:adenylate kinase
MRILIFGPQGAGKGTQTARIAEKYGITSIATGEIFRWAIKGKTALGNKVTRYVDAGKLVPDHLTVEVVRERLSAEDVAAGFILDGFPRTTHQAEALETVLEEQDVRLDAAIVIDVPEEVSLRRLLGRRVCPNCGRNYHVDNPPENDWICDACGGEVVARGDDHEETIRERLRLYHEQTALLKDFYEERDLLLEIDGGGTPDEVFQRIVAAL